MKYALSLYVGDLKCKSLVC